MSDYSSSQLARRWRRRAWMGMALPAAFLTLPSVPAVAQGAKPNPSDLDRVKPGVAAPALTLPDAQGKTHSLASFRGTATVLVFYRGYW